MTARNELDAGLREARYAAEQAHKLLAKGIKQRRWNDIGLARQHVKAIRAALAVAAPKE